jgi:hypothetical protein
MTKILEFLVVNPEVACVGIRLKGNGAEAFALMLDDRPGFRIHNVGEIDEVVDFLRANPECKSVKFGVNNIGLFIIRSTASIADNVYEIERCIDPIEVDFKHWHTAREFLRDVLKDFSGKLTGLRHKFSLKHA